METGNFTTTMSTEDVPLCLGLYKLRDVIMYQVLSCYIGPTLSLAGFIANMLCLAILKRSGLHKLSNILLYGLVISDSMYLMFLMNYANPILIFGPNKPFPELCGFQYHIGVNYFLVATYYLCTFFGYWGEYVSPFLQAFITIERLLAIFLPLTFKRIVTRNIVLCCIFFCYFFWLPWVLLITTNMTVFVYYPDKNVQWMGVFHNYSAGRINLSLLMTLLEAICNYFPLFIIVAGSIAIQFKIRFFLKERQRLAAGQNLTLSTKTTKILLMTCFVFILSHISSCLVVYIYPSNTKILGAIRGNLSALCYSIACSSNLIIFILINQNFYAKFIHLFTGKS